MEEQIEKLQTEINTLTLYLKRVLDDCQSKLYTVGPVLRLEIEAFLEAKERKRTVSTPII